MLRAPKHRLVSDRFLLQISALPRQFSAAEIRRGKQLMNALLPMQRFSLKVLLIGHGCTKS
jgi:hypothetical protein